MGSILDNCQIKEKCQKFTPNEIVKTMLDMAGYTRNLFGQTILENSFGSGNILTEIVRRYILDGLTNQLDNDTISRGLSEDIFGIELDENLYLECITKLNEILREYNIPDTKWNFFCTDTLRWNAPLKFDYVIGNPPYVTYSDIDLDSRNFIKQKYISCKNGKFDYCYAFIESGINCLSEHGKLVQLIPSNIYKNVFGNDLRKILLQHLCEIKEYPNYNMFKDTLTSNSIFLFNNGYDLEQIAYENVTKGIKLNISKKILNDKWVFMPKKSQETQLVRFGDRFHASITVATLLNEAFIIGEDAYNRSVIEPEILKKTTSPRNMRFNKKEFIIFPYYFDDDGKIQHYSVESFERLFPLTVKYLRKFKEKLDNRNKDKSAQWFEYGRSQAICHQNQEKLLMSTVVTNKVEIYMLDSDIVPFSGIYIITNDKRYSLSDAEKILRSNDFLQYVQNIGISVSGNSKRITCNDINNYEFKE